jgi:tetratricopeptide (TPR) repeat protein
MGSRRVPRIRHLPYAGARPLPIFGRWLLTDAVSLRPVTRDNPGEMGGRVASPTLVGRIEELELLEAARGRAADGEPAVVLVGGEAGVGKTRLVAELTARGADRMRVLYGGCVPVGGDGLPYAPIVEALRPLPDELGVDTVRELAGPSWPELARLLPSLGAPESGPPGAAAQVRLFELLLGLLVRLSAQMPVALVIEDLHWSDQSTRDLLAFMVRNVRQNRILLMATYRSDEPGQQRLGAYLAELDRGGPVQRLELPRLDKVQTIAQLTGILGVAPSVDLVDGVFARSEGNPFFTEELLATVQAGSAQLPTTLRDLLQGRMEALPDPAQKILRVAAVAGRQVSHPLVAAVAGLNEEQLNIALREAVAHQLLVTREDRYQFRHALVQEVVDAGLLPGERAQLHAAHARALTEGPELAAGSPAVTTAELALHWDAAGDAAQALPARVEAGLAAEEARAFAEAASHYQRALQIWERVPDPGQPAGLDRIDLLARAADTTAFAGGVEGAVGLLEDALDRVDPAVEPGRAAVLLARLGDHRRVAGDESRALAAYQEAERLVAAAPPSAERARVFAAHAYALTQSHRAREGFPRCEEAIATAQVVEARTEEAKALRVLATCLIELGDLDRGITVGLETRRLAQAVGDIETVVGTYMVVSVGLALAGRERDAVADAQQGYQHACELGLERALGSYVAVNLAQGFLDMGRWAQCERPTRELLAGDSWDASGLHQVLGMLLTRRGEFEAAREQLNLALQLSPPVFRAMALRGPAELALWEARHDEAGAAVAEGLDWLVERDPDGTHAHYRSLWYPLALRLEADRAEQAAARRVAEEVAEARRRAAPVLAALDLLAAAPTPQARYLPVAGHLGLAQAERSRLEGRSDPEGWRAAAIAWERLEYPFDAAYARFREAEALLADGAPRHQVETVLRAAHQTTVALGAEPLRREIELLAQRGRLHLEEPMDTTASPEAPPSPAASLGLTRREVEVLALVAEGRTNRQIGQALFITPKDRQRPRLTDPGQAGGRRSR